MCMSVHAYFWWSESVSPAPAGLAMMYTGSAMELPATRTPDAIDFAISASTGPLQLQVVLCPLVLSFVLFVDDDDDDDPFEILTSVVHDQNR